MVIPRDQGPPLDLMFVNLSLEWRPSFVGRVLKQAIDLGQLEVEFASHLKRYGDPVLALDSWGFDFFSQRLQSRGIKCELLPMHLGAQAPRASLLASLFKQGRVSLPDNPETVRQLKSLRVYRSPGGQMRFSAPNTRGARDDHAKALMLLAPRIMALSPAAGSLRRVSDLQSTWWEDHGVRVAAPPGTPEWELERAQRWAKKQFTPEEMAEAARTGRKLDDMIAEGQRIVAEHAGNDFQAIAAFIRAR
jgi:hypothetical protein